MKFLFEVLSIVKYESHTKRREVEREILFVVLYLLLVCCHGLK